MRLCWNELKLNETSNPEISIKLALAAGMGSTRECQAQLCEWAASEISVNLDLGFVTLMERAAAHDTEYLKMLYGLCRQINPHQTRRGLINANRRLKDAIKLIKDETYLEQEMIR